MLTLLSPAKKLDFVRPIPTDTVTEPALREQAAVILAVARQLDQAAIAELMDLSDDLAASTHARFQDLTFDETGGRAAMLAFAGDVYQALDAPSLSPADLAWAQDHLAILSGLYGLLRPLDRMRPYRLEMGSRLANPGGKDLVSYWRPILTPHVDALVAGHAEPVLLNLASDEYFSALDRRRMRARVVTPVFQDVRDGRPRSLFLFVKRARGALARWIVEQRADRVEALRDAVVLDYRFVSEPSDEGRWVFRRPQPPAVG